METHEAARAQFDRQARQYNERWAGWTDETLKRMLELAEPQPHWRVLDVATGTGFTALAFAPLVESVVGSDISSGMLAEAARRAQKDGVDNVDWVQAPAEKLPFDDGAFDAVTVRVAPHHFVDVPAFLAEVRRVLAPGGVFLLGDTSVPDDDLEAAAWQNAVEKERDPSHIANLSPSRWKELAEAAGLRVTDCEYRPGTIPIELDAWLETAGCTGERAERVRAAFVGAPESARRHFRIEAEDPAAVRFSWARVILRAV